MSSGSRRASQFLQEKEDEVPQWIPGLGNDKPKPRTLGTSFFGYVPDAFVEKTPYLPSEKTTTTTTTATAATATAAEDEACCTSVLHPLTEGTKEENDYSEDIDEIPLTTTTTTTTNNNNNGNNNNNNNSNTPHTNGQVVTMSSNGDAVTEEVCTGHQEKQLTTKLNHGQLNHQMG
ncbi:hypothetical protein Pmani_040003 [Petrolisthes manimaculis]|uniref:Uncharacterized protein n=1 Tax=Petrolisthes manimaculis TaxID=1843537 RepID=A0AAE1NBS0_9EUCA|nr:hypothetical protein Pmani_040003 [Petrolisthes manimaculis]